MNVKKNTDLPLWPFLFATAFTLCVTTAPLSAHQVRMDDDADLESIDSEEGEELPAAPVLSPEEPLWTATRPPRTRETYYTYPCYPALFNDNKLDINLFYNKNTRLAHVFKDYLNMDYLRAKLIPQFGSRENGTRVADLLSRFTIHERRIGAAFQYDVPLTDHLQIEFTLPFLVSLRHLWLPVKSQEEIKAAFKEMDEDGAEDNPGSKELANILSKISTKSNVGDIGLRLGYLLPEINKVKSAVGIEILVPSSSLFQGKKPLSKPVLKELLTGAVTNLDDMVVVFKEMRIVAMRPSYGSDGHLGVGGFFQLKIPLFSDRFDFWSIARFTHYLPRTQFRFLPMKASSPAEFEIKVHPGSIVHLIHGLDWHLGTWTVQAGYDFYTQYKESISRIVNLPEWTVATTLSDAERPDAIQHKLFGSVSYRFPGQSTDVQVTLGGDTTIGHAGIGRGYTAMINVGAYF